MNESTLPQLGCGRCGYPARGISTLVCPECGADLTKVGIVRGGKRRRLIALVVVPVVFTIIVFVLSVAIFDIAQGLLPQHRDWSLSVQGRPHSGEFDEVRFGLKAKAVVPYRNSSPFGVGGNTGYNGNKPVGNLTVTKAATAASVYDAWIIIAPKSSSPTAVNDWMFNIDPNSGRANWTDAKTNTRQTSSGKLTDQDLLAMLKSLDADTTNPDLLIEAQQIAAMADALINAVNSPSTTTNVSVNNISFWAYGSGGSVTPGPPWFQPSYIAAWVVIWLTGLVWMIRRSLKQRKAWAAQT